MNLTFLISLLTGEAAEMAAQARRSVVAYLIAGLAGLCALFFLIVAGFVYVADNLRFGALNTALVFAGVLLLLAVLVLLFHRLGRASRVRRARERRKGEVAAAAGAAAIAVLPTLLSRRGGAAGLLVPVAALLAYGVFRESARSRARPDDDKP